MALNFKSAISCGGASLVIFNALMLLGCVLTNTEAARELDLPHYSYTGQDYPLTYPIFPLETVAMTLHESVHFSLNASDPLAHDEWVLYSSIPKGIGRTRLGPQQRVFVITVGHQMHCLRRIQAALVNREDPHANPAHVSHCLNYLRQTLLCEAAHMLERGDFMHRSFDLDRIGDTLVCKDWEGAFKFFDKKYEEWQEWRDVLN
ncbi:hypothetical protein DFH06DRAFT_359759 [Mycena polygramma]|nr:hypothetical protein DFH06DRAFT_359759 [Mycena polygramma]